ncbi:gamma-glutamylcyclotransferase family protein [Deinococcus maricopensis]|uniref:AIG2 family protein n=1 Tax=Deinococcus maricopensis (strain DSM 21211 / LMG 22137 / NRRL B-23946 / LB-34) TaxID=709986 RepID=E8U4H9_DEIML|nr:gamma-glutamylcyclotransferase family protein [Deinococcus maricopensis]ADV68844.1 AIG2 family protein [Deinococcus maricopensis DSM 21211]
MTRSASPDDPPRVFVYGTLMPGERNAHVAGAGVHAARATLAGFALFHLEPEGYPVLRPDPDAAPVQGWVYTYAPAAWTAALPGLDALEGVHDQPPLYARVRAVAQAAGSALEAWVYVFVRHERLRQGGAVRVPGGDWAARRHGSP